MRYGIGGLEQGAAGGGGQGIVPDLEENASILATASGSAILEVLGVSLTSYGASN